MVRFLSEIKRRLSCNFQRALKPTKMIQIGWYVTDYEFSCLSRNWSFIIHTALHFALSWRISHTGQRLLSAVRIKFNNRSRNPFADVCRIVWKIQIYPAFSSLSDNISMLIPPISRCIIHSVQECRPACRLEILSNIFHYSHMVPIFSPFAITLDHDL